MSRDDVNGSLVKISGGDLDEFVKLSDNLIEQAKQAAKEPDKPKALAANDE